MRLTRQAVLYIASALLLLFAWLVHGDVITITEPLFNFVSLLVLAAAAFVAAHVP
jgi:hypothetical protein